MSVRVCVCGCVGACVGACVCMRPCACVCVCVPGRNVARWHHLTHALSAPRGEFAELPGYCEICKQRSKRC